MAEKSFDTLSTARGLQAAGIDADQAAAIVGAIRSAVSDLVTVERFEAGLGELRAHIDTGLAETKVENARARLALAGFIIGANALMLTVAGFVLAAVLSA
ncbi:MAG: hypothetical protein OXQ29_10180 [Rhodospirillaceae bacterium]|nr:hypothetical protein [Rhodospirillaceae bacterium]